MQHLFGRKVLTALAVIGALGLTAPAVAKDRSDWPDSFTVGTASQGGTYFVYGSGWANLVSEALGVNGGGAERRPRARHGDHGSRP